MAVSVHVTSETHSHVTNRTEPVTAVPGGRESTVQRTCRSALMTPISAVPTQPALNRLGPIFACVLQGTRKIRMEIA